MKKLDFFVPECCRRPILAGIIFIALVLALPAPMARAADANEAGPGYSTSPLIDYFRDWFDRVDKTKAEQPHWPSLMSATTPCLLEAFRYDISQQSLAGGHTLTSFGSGKGLEFIPAEHIQLIAGVPAWQTLNTSPRKDGWADQGFLMKYRFWSANESNGNYIVTGFLGLSVPNGSDNYTTHHFIFTPTAAFGKGWGHFDIQSTLGVALPDNERGRHTLGTPIAFNATAQYNLAKIFWPEVEVNYTYWPNGKHEGLNQAFITPGLVVGNFPVPVWHRLKLQVGVGCQFAVTDHPLYHRNIILSVKLPF